MQYETVQFFVLAYYTIKFLQFQPEIQNKNVMFLTKCCLYNLTTIETIK